MKREYKASIWMKLWIKRIAGKKNILLLMLLFLILTIYLEPLKSFVSISGIVVQLSRHKFNLFIMNRYM